MNISLILFIIGCIFVIIGYVNQISEINNNMETKSIELNVYKDMVNNSLIT